MLTVQLGIVPLKQRQKKIEQSLCGMADKSDEAKGKEAVVGVVADVKTL